MLSKFLGGVLLVVGTTVGAGILALPVVTAQAGFLGSTLLIMTCWWCTTQAALLFLKINLRFPDNSNLITMARATLGMPGLMVSWITYLLLLYSLLCAYTAGGGDLLHHLILRSGANLSHSSCVVCFNLLLGGVVYVGIRSVDYANRFFMLFKMGGLLLLVGMLSWGVDVSSLGRVSWSHVADHQAWGVVLTSFGFAPILPSLRTYFQSDPVVLKRLVWAGSTVPLICYLAWNAAVMGNVPLQGPDGLEAVAHAGLSNSALVRVLVQHAHARIIPVLVHLFTSVCMVTSFLGVSLCLVDFLADALGWCKQGVQGVLLHSLVFVPPVCAVVFWPGLFIPALAYAGLYCVVLLIVLPVWMAWRVRAQAR